MTIFVLPIYDGDDKKTFEPNYHALCFIELSYNVPKNKINVGSQMALSTGIMRIHSHLY